MDYFDWKPLKSFQNYLPSSIFEMSNLSIVKKKFKYVSKAVGKACLTNDTRVTDTGSILLAKKSGRGLHWCQFCHSDAISDDIYIYNWPVNPSILPIFFRVTSAFDLNYDTQCMYARDESVFTQILKVVCDVIELVSISFYLVFMIQNLWCK